jgi:beta-glucosidase
MIALRSLALVVGLALLFASLAEAGVLRARTPSSRPRNDQPTCLGEFEICPTGECVLIADWCGKCTQGQYLCPDGQTCVQGAEGYLSCPAIKGTHLDWTLSVDERIAYFVQAATLDVKIQQLQNQAPAIPELGIPFYNCTKSGSSAHWRSAALDCVCSRVGVLSCSFLLCSGLNDDVHSVNRHHATVFPNGCGLGATWNKLLLFDVGYMIGNEARATHNGLVHEGDRGVNENAAGMTIYSPNMNLVRDPRWSGKGRRQWGLDRFFCC